MMWNSTREFPNPLLFLIYTNDLPNCSNALTFSIFADDTNVFASVRNVKVLEKTVYSELKKVKILCDVNRLLINFSKTNFMIIKSQKKKDDQVNINIESADSTINVPQKQKIKYLGVLLNDTMSFNHHISYVCARIARNNGIISKLSHYFTFLGMKTVKQTIGYAACVIWDKIPLNLKELRVYLFSKQLKPYLLSEQQN